MSTVVMLHGLGDSKEALAPLTSALMPEVKAVSLNLIGHGGRQVPDQFSTQIVAEDVIEALDRAEIEKAILFGWSFGGRVALYIARHFPDRIQGVCAFGTSFLRDPGMIQAALIHYNPNRIRSVPLTEHNQSLFPVIHHWLLTAPTREMDITEEDMTLIKAPVLILGGTNDPMVSVDESKLLYSLVPNARLVLFEGTVHPARAIPLDVVREHFLKFFKDVEALEQSRSSQAAQAC